MLRIHKVDQEAIREKIREGRIEGAALGRGYSLGTNKLLQDRI
jgi:hypothetical protein